MPAKAVVTGVVLIIMVMLLVYMVELFLPLSKKAELDMLCRNTLLKMESNGGLSPADSMALRSELEKKGLVNVEVTATAAAGRGDLLTLSVEGDYTFSKLDGLFRRSDTTIHMVYNKFSVSRKVIN